MPQSLEKNKQKQQKNSASSRAATLRRRRRRSALCLSLSSIMAGVDLAMEGIPRYVCDLFLFFLSLSSTHSKRERCLKSTTTCVFRPRFDFFILVRNVFLSLHACAKRVNSSLLLSSFKNKLAKHAHCDIIKTTEDLEYSKPPRSTFYGKRKGCSPPDRLPGNTLDRVV